MTTQKIKLLHHSAAETNLTSQESSVKKIVEQYFDIIRYEPGVNYNPADTVLIVPQSEYDKNFWWQSFVNEGFKMIIDNVTEVPEFMLPLMPVPESSMVLQGPNFFRYSDALNWLRQGYDHYRPNRQLVYKALVLMSNIKDYRTQLVEKLGTQLDQCIWSYIAQGKQLNHTDVPLTPDTAWSRYLNPDWFDLCCFSIVAETIATSLHPSVNRVPFVTEKTWKSVAMQHPFMIVGEPGTLQHLHSLGFETFENLWPENYDTTQSTSHRIDQVVENVAQYNMTPLDQLTLQKLKHNCNQFFNRDLIQQGLVNEIINPIFKYVSK